MKTISLRAFRVAVDRLAEPVQVVKREDGALRTLGTWTPVSTMTDSRALDGIRPGEPQPSASFNSRPFTPVPKRSK
jgi:hypothetical protein